MFHTAWRFPLGHRVECIRDGRLVEAGVGVALGLIGVYFSDFQFNLTSKDMVVSGSFLDWGKKGENTAQLLRAVIKTLYRLIMAVP